MAGRTVNETFTSRSEAVAYAKSIEVDKHRGVAVDPKAGQVPFDAYAADWLTLDPSKRPSSRARDASVVRNYLAPTFRSKPIAAITQEDIQRAVNQWSKKLAPASVGRMYTTLQAIFSTALAADRIAKTPCRNIRLPEGAKPSDAGGRVSHIITPAELDDLVRRVGPNYGAMIEIGAKIGLRWGEIAGLRVGDIDLRNASISISRQRTRGEHGEMIEAEPKSRAGVRRFVMPQSLVRAVKTHISNLTNADAQAYLFVTERGAPLNYSNWRRRVWEPACQAVGLDGLHFHDLRHASATAQIHGGVDVRTAAKRHGADIDVMLKIYAQVTDEADRRAAELIDAYWRSKPRKNWAKTAQPHPNKSKKKAL
jgi:integrase